MVSISAFTPASSVTGTALLHKPSLARPSVVLRLPTMAKMGKLRCSAEGRRGEESSLGMGASVMAVTMSSPAAMALVDERMSTEGTGLPFGLSNNLLGWILFGVFGLIWTLYFTYTSTLDEDDESGMSL